MAHPKSTQLQTPPFVPRRPFPSPPSGCLPASTRVRPLSPIGLVPRPHPALSFAPTGCPARAKCESPACKAGLPTPLHPQDLNGRHPTGMAWLIQKAPNSRPHPSFPADLFPRPHQAAYLPQPGSPFVPHRACGSPHPALSFAPTGCPARAKCESPACKAGLDPPITSPSPEWAPPHGHGRGRLYLIC